MISFILKKNKLSFENRREFTVSKEIIQDYNLNNRSFLEKEEYNQLMNRVVKNYSIYLLAKKDYFEKDIKEKLESVYFDKKIVSEIIDFLKGKGYINDNDLVDDYIVAHKNYGAKKIEYNLLIKGIDKNIIKHYLEKNKEFQFQEIEREFSMKKDEDVEKKIQRLMRKGFQYKDIIKVLNDGRGR